MAELGYESLSGFSGLSSAGTFLAFALFVGLPLLALGAPLRWVLTRMGCPDRWLSAFFAVTLVFWMIAVFFGVLLGVPNWSPRAETAGVVRSLKTVGEGGFALYLDDAVVPYLYADS